MLLDFKFIIHEFAMNEQLNSKRKKSLYLLLNFQLLALMVQ